MDLTANPGADFHRFCNGGWLDRTKIPAEYPRWGMFMQLRDQALDYLHSMFDRLAKAENAPGSNAQKISDLYALGMDEESIEAEGLTGLDGLFAQIKRIRNRRQLMNAMASPGLASFFGFGAATDYDNSDQMIANASQGGTSLERDYYLKTDKDTVEKRAAFVAYMQRMFELLDERPKVAARHAAEVIALETSLATISMDIETLRDPGKSNNKMTRAQFQALCPELALGHYVDTLKAPAFEIVNVRQPEFFKALGAIVANTPMSVLRTYMRFHLIDGMASYLPKRFGDASFDFYGKVMQGTQVRQERWKRITGLVSGVLGEAVGEVYVAEKFPPAAKARMLELNDAMKEAMREIFSEMTWLSEQTRSYAIQKLEAFVCNIGYPDKWRDYSGLTIDRQSLTANMLRVGQFNGRRNLNKIGTAVDRAEWGMTPQTVNAQCNQSKNMTFFPAAIFQPPFFDMLADFAFLCGAICAVIGHENWHNFDDKGSKFNLKGNMANWWTDADRANFDALMQQIRNLFAGFVVVEAADGKEAVHMKGGLVCGEAISDLMGLRIAYRALQKMIAKYGRTTDENGYNDEQRFFIAFGQLWCSKARPAYQAWQAANDPHPIDRFRIAGTLANMPEFFQAFNLPSDCAMAIPEHMRCDLIAGPKQ